MTLVNEDAERAVLGSMLLDPERWVVAERLKPSDFAIPAHAEIWEAMRTAVATRKHIDVITVRSKLTTREADAALRVAEEQTLTTAGLAAHVGIVRDLGARRALVRAATSIIETANDDLLETAVVQDLVEAAYMRGLLALRGETEPVTATLALAQALQTAQDIRDRKRAPGVPFGMRRLDDKTGGLRRREVTVLAGKTGRGKSALGWQLAYNVVRAGFPVLGFNLEMENEIVALRLLSAHLRVDSTQIPWQLANHSAEIVAFSEELHGGAWFGLIDNPEVTIGQLRGHARRAKAEHKDLALIVVDYLQLVESVPARGGSREREVAAVSKGLKMLAKELNVAVLALAQLNRRSGEDENREPRLSDLRESGTIEQDAALVLMLHEPDPDAVNRPEGRQFEIHVPKNRHGKGAGVLPMIFHPAFTTFEEGTLPALEGEPAKEGEPAPKRGRGRPRKHPKPDQLAIGAVPAPEDT